MCDESKIKESLEFCRQIKSYDIYTTENVEEDADRHNLFEEVYAEIEEKKENRPWEKIADIYAADFEADISSETLRQKYENGGIVKSSLLYDISDNSVYGKTEGFEAEVFYSGEQTSTKRSIVFNVAVFVCCVLLAFGLASGVTKYVAHQTMVEGESMEPSLHDKDSVVIEKVSYYFGDPKRFDVVVFPVDTDKGRVYYIKRVIGLPGEIVQILDGSVYINGVKLKGDYYSKEDILYPGVAKQPFQLRDDEYFVLGDNRNNSADSRYGHVGMVKRKNITGEAVCCIWPPSHWKKL